MEQRIIRVGSRESRLAVAQAELVMESIRKCDPTLRLELVTMKTTGDKILDTTLDKIGGKGLFVKELDKALEDGRVDLTVHSLKDMPVELREGLPIAALSRREDARDVLVLPQGQTTLDPEKPIGCASARRRVQLRELFMGVSIAPVRGNVQTRLAKLDSGQYGALVLAAAGIIRLGLTERVSRMFSIDELLPSAGQGVIAVQCRAGEDVGYLRLFHDEETAQCVTAERAFVAALGGGCSSPVAAHARLEGGILTLAGLYVGEDEGLLVRDTITGNAVDAQRLGVSLAQRLSHVNLM